METRSDGETVLHRFERGGELTQSDLTFVLGAEQKRLAFFHDRMAFALFAGASCAGIEVGNFPVRQKSGLGLGLRPFTLIQSGQN